MQLAGQDAELPEIRLRSKVFAVVVVAGLLALASRLFFLQVLRGDELYRLTSESIVRTTALPPVRGELRDRKGRPLATTRASFDVAVAPAALNADDYAEIARILEDHPELPAWEKVEAAARQPRPEPLTVAEDVSPDQLAAIATRVNRDAVTVKAEPRRRYPYGPLFAHTIGYLNEIKPDEVKRRREEGYRPGDRVGRTGLERQWEGRLRGQRGYEKSVVDRRNRPLPVAVTDLVDGPIRVEAIPGDNVILTLDLDVQRAAEEALRDKPAGAAVVVEVKTGRLLAMVSVPAYDPNLLSGRVTREEQARLTSDPYRPFRDKTLADTYNPGSTFKVITAIAALDDQLLPPEHRVFCRGHVELGKRRFRCTHQHGQVNFLSGMVQSCNIFFYDLGGRPGMMNRIAGRATSLGLGAPTGLGINGEVAGLVPTEEWHRARPDAGGAFSMGHALNTAIGEGATRVTVTQIAMVYAALANGGHLMQPQLVLRIEDAKGKVREDFPPRERRVLDIKPATLDLLRRSLTGVVNDRTGTAYRVRSSKVLIAGKTGTAQTHLSVKRVGDKATGKGDHAWFAGFAPADDPQVAFAVLVEHGGFGGEVSAPVARHIVESYLGPGAGAAAVVTEPAPP